MRPAQLTPENTNGVVADHHAFRSFNEAGAINAGKLRALQVDAQRAAASMRPAQLTPENRDRHRQGQRNLRASMRPAQLTPENLNFDHTGISSLFMLQ